MLDSGAGIFPGCFDGGVGLEDLSGILGGARGRRGLEGLLGDMFKKMMGAPESCDDLKKQIEDLSASGVLNDEEKSTLETLCQELADLEKADIERANTREERLTKLNQERNHAWGKQRSLDLKARLEELKSEPEGLDRNEETAEINRQLENIGEVNENARSPEDVEKERGELLQNSRDEDIKSEEAKEKISENIGKIIGDAKARDFISKKVQGACSSRTMMGDILVSNVKAIADSNNSLINFMREMRSLNQEANRAFDMQREKEQAEKLERLVKLGFSRGEAMEIILKEIAPRPDLADKMFESVLANLMAKMAGM